MNEFVKLIEESPNGYVEKLRIAVELKIVRNLSRNMLRELISYYKIYNPNFDERMISCSSCPTSLIKFMTTVGNAYFECKEAEEKEEIVNEQIIEETEDIIEKNEEIEPKIEQILPKSKNKNS